MTLAAIHDADMAVILRDAGNLQNEPLTFTFSGSDYACLLSDRVRRKDLEEGGFVPDYDLAIHTRLSLMPDPPPDAGDTVTVAGTNYRVVRQRKNFTGTLLVLDLMTTEK